MFRIWALKLLCVEVYSSCHCSRLRTATSGLQVNLAQQLW